MRIKRMGESTPRLTHGKEYDLDSNGYITDDNGRSMRPVRNNPHTWCKVAPVPVPMAPPACPPPVPRAPMPAPMPDPYKIEITWDGKELHNSPIGEMKMLTIKKNANLINGMDSDLMPAETLMAHIKREQAQVDALDEFKVDSKAITKLRNKHNHNIHVLVEILDAKGEDES